MPYETTLIYNESLLRQAVFSFWRRSIGIGFIVAIGAIAVCLGVLVAQGEATSLVGALATVLALGIVSAASLYLVHSARTFGGCAMTDVLRHRAASPP